MNFHLNSITLKYKNFIIFEKNNEYFEYNKILKVFNTLEKLNLKPTQDFIESLYYLNKKDLNLLNKKLNEIYSKIFGMNLRKSFSSKENLEEEKIKIEETAIQLYMYYETYYLKNFPKELNDYIKFKKIKPKKRNSFKKIIDYKNNKEFMEDIENIIKLPVVFGEIEKEYLNEIFKYDKEIILEQISSNIKIKENLIYLLNFLNNDDILNKNLIKTPTDILRFIYKDNIYMIRNKKSNTFFKISTSNKKFIFKLLENILNNNNFENIYEDFYSKKSHWKRIMNNIHPFSKKFKKYKKSIDLFSKLYNNIKPQGFNYKKELYIKNKEYIKLIDLLSMNSGYLLRNIDFLIRKINEEEFEYLLKRIKKIKNNLNLKFLINISKLLKYRSNNKQENIIYKLINISYESSKNKDLLDKNRVSKITLLFNNIIKESLVKKELFSFNKKIYLSKDLKNIILPDEMRTFSIYKNNIQYTPGSRIKIKNDLKFLRFFTAWGTKKVKQENFDIDLSAGFVKNNTFKAIAYYNQTEDFAVHSGDFTYCMKWNNKRVITEFIDIDLKKSINNFNYFIMNSGIYDSSNLSNSFSKDIKTISGIISLKNRIKEENELINISNNLFELELIDSGDNHIPFAFDFSNNEIVIIDKYIKVGNNQNISSIKNKIEIYKREYFLAKHLKENIYDFLYKYIKANSFEIVNNKKESDLIIDLNIDEKFQNKDYFLINKDNLYKIYNLLN